MHSLLPDRLIQVAEAKFLSGKPPARNRYTELLAQTQLGNQSTIALDIGGLQVLQQAAALDNQQQQTTTGEESLLVNVQVLVQLLDTSGQQCNLNLGGTGVALVTAVLCDNLCLSHLHDCFLHPSISPQTRYSVGVSGVLRKRICGLLIFCHDVDYTIPLRVCKRFFREATSLFPQINIAHRCPAAFLRCSHRPARSMPGCAWKTPSPRPA